MLRKTLKYLLFFFILVVSSLPSGAHAHDAGPKPSTFTVMDVLLGLMAPIAFVAVAIAIVSVVDPLIEIIVRKVKEMTKGQG